MSRTILIADDSDINRRILRAALCQDYEVLEAANGAEVLELLLEHRDKVSAVLLDIVMPVMDGLEALKRIRANPMLTQIPVIMITGSEEETARNKCLVLGANDFVLKPYNPDVIKHCLRNNIALNETSATVNQLRRDRLTGLYNRERFFEIVSERVASCEPGHYVMASFDINKFKVINDQYGTRKGDDVLKYIADVFKTGFEAHGGIVCRIAADNYAVLYPASFKDNEELTKIRRRAGDIEGLISPITFSIGRYLITDLSLTPDTMYDRATLAASTIKGLYDVEIATYDESMRDRLIREQEVVTEMSSALSERQFEAWYQPQYNHATGALIGSEALVRWRHPKKGMISPGVFVPVFERNGFIYSLDKYVWEEVCRFLRRCMDSGIPALPVSVNISRHDVFRPDIVDVITGLVKKYDIPVDLLRLEVTESAFSKSAAQIISVVEQLIDAGFTVEIDDFGSGYSSLNTLKDVPAQVLKLDMRFLESSTNSSRGGNIVESIVRMAKWLGMSIIAEGVETMEQADYLSSIGCCYIQGYLYSKPIPMADYEALCRKTQAEEKLLALETVEGLDNSSFWDPTSMDTLIFNSYVGGACISEYHNGHEELLRVNKQYLKTFSDDITIDDVFIYKAADYMDDENRRKLTENIERAISTGMESTCETVSRGLYGIDKDIYIRSTVRVIARTEDRYLLYCTVINTTAQREAERRQADIAEKLSLVLNNMNGAVMATVFDEDGTHFLMTNEQYYEQLGYTKAQYDAEIKDVFTLFHPDDRERVAKLSRSASETKQPYTVKYRVIRRDGEIRWLQSNVSITTFPNEALPVQLAVVNDITEQVAAEESSQRTTKQIQAILDNVDLGIIATVVNGSKVDYLLSNDKYYEMLGYTREQFSAEVSTPFSTVAPEDRQRALEDTRKLNTTGTPTVTTYNIIKRDGSKRCFKAIMSTGKFAGIDEPVQLSIFRDITFEEDRRKDLLDNLPHGAALYEFNGKELVAIHRNKRYWELMQRFDTDMPLSSTIHPDDRSILLREFDAAVKQERDISCDLRIQCGENEYKPFHVDGRIVLDRPGVYLVFTTYTPISNASMSYQQMLPKVLSSIMDSTSDLLFTKDKDLRYICASRAFANMAGFESESDIIGKTDYEIFPKEIADKYRHDDETLLETGSALIDMVEVIPSPDDVPRYSSTSKYPLRDATGKFIGIYGLGRDITQYRDTFSKLKLLLDSIPGGIATYECMPGYIKLLYFNDGFCRLFNYTHDEYEKKASVYPTSLIYTEDLPRLTAQIDRLLHDGTPINCVYRVHVRGGGYKWISHRAVGVERNGERVIINALLQDVTEQIELTEKLRQSEEENNLAIKLGGSIVCRYDISERTLTLSRDVAAINKLPEKLQNIPNEPIDSGFISPDSRQAYLNFFKDIQSGEKTCSAIFKQNYLGEWRWLEAKSASVFSNDGKPIKAMISFFDVTDRLERETVYRKWQQSLENKDPQSYTLYRCNLNKDASFDTVEGSLLSVDFSNVGLDFNSRAIEYVNQCVYEDDKEKYKAFIHSDTLLANYYRGKRADSLEYREVLPDGSTRWLRLSVELVEYPNSTDIEAYLMYENINEKKCYELRTKALAETDPLTGILNRAAFAALVEAAIRKNPDSKHALIMLDIDGFKQVNDAFGHGAGDITLKDIANSLRSIIRHDDLTARLGGDEFIVFLSNIPDESIAASKAQQICALTRKSFSFEVHISASVGIAIAQRDGVDFDTLYKKADSALYFVKGSGKNGYAFYRDNMQNEHLGLVDEDNALVNPKEKKRRMLIIDDSVFDYKVLTNIFSDEFIVESVGDGTNALIRLKHYGSAISIILLDLMMPGIDGLTVLEKLKSNPELQAIPVIIVSGDERRDTCLKAIRLGAADFITKPVDAELIRIRVRSAISKAENERLRAKNSFLEMQNEERLRYETALGSTGLAVIEYDRLKSSFTYYPSISSCLWGTYDERNLWHILLLDNVTDKETIQSMQQFVHDVANSHDSAYESMKAKLRTPSGAEHTFRINARRLKKGFPSDKLILTLMDMEYNG